MDISVHLLSLPSSSRDFNFRFCITDRLKQNSNHLNICCLYVQGRSTCVTAVVGLHVTLSSIFKDFISCCALYLKQTQTQMLKCPNFLSCMKFQSNNSIHCFFLLTASHRLSSASVSAFSGRTLVCVWVPQQCVCKWVQIHTIKCRQGSAQLHLWTPSWAGLAEVGGLTDKHYLQPSLFFQNSLYHFTIVKLLWLSLRARGLIVGISLTQTHGNSLFEI